LATAIASEAGQALAIGAIKIGTADVCRLFPLTPW
jgi:hypothetical protein